jgi:hypothetical protein
MALQKTTLRDWLEAKARREFSLSEWTERILNAKSERAMEWDSQAEDGWAIRTSKLPLGSSLSGIPTTDPRKQQAEKFFVDNWIKKGIEWRVSLLIGGNVFLDLKSKDGGFYEDQQLLENSINWAFIYQKYLSAISPCLFDREFVGYGVFRQPWDAERIDKVWKNGMPMPEWIDARKVWFQADNSTLSRLRLVYHEEEFDTKQLREEFPSFADRISETEGSRKTTKVGILQYLRTYKIDKIVVENMLTGQSEVYTAQELSDAKDDMAEAYSTYSTTGTVPQNYAENEFFSLKVREFLQVAAVPGAQTLPSPDVFRAWIEDAFLPEQVMQSTPVRSKEDCWFQAIMLPDSWTLLQEPQYVGPVSGYSIILGEKRDGTVYTFGTAYEDKDKLDSSIINMTILTKLVAKMNKPTPFVEEDSLTDMEDFQENFWKTAYAAVVSKKWRSGPVGQTGRDPIKFELPPINASLPMALYQMVNEAIKTNSGAVDSARGQQQYEQSGVLQSQLQNASMSYMQNTIFNYVCFLRDIGETLKYLLSKHRDYPHMIRGLDISTLQENVTWVNTTPENTLDGDKYYVEPVIDTNPQGSQQLENQERFNYYQAGVIPRIELLRGTPWIHNPDKIEKENIEQQGLTEIVNKLQQFPELAQMIQQYEGQPEPGPQKTKETTV